MSLIACFTALKNETLNQIVQKKLDKWKLAESGDAIVSLHETVKALSQQVSEGGDGKWETRDEIALDIASNEGRQECVDRAWHAIHYTLTYQTADALLPLGFIMNGGQALPGEYEGSEPRGFSSDDTKAIAEALDAITDDYFRARYDAKALRDQEIYPDLDWADADIKDYVADHFLSLRDFLSFCANHEMGMLVTLN